MATRDQAQALYAAYFARPADAGGLEYWTNGLGLSTPLELIADGFAVTDEYRETVLSKSLAEIIDGFYFNLFGRISEKEGRDFWVTTIQDGLTTTQQAGLVIGQAAVDSPGNSDHEAIMAKILASNLFTDETGKTQQGLLAYQGPEAIQQGTKYLSAVRSEETIPSPEQVSAYVASFSAIDDTIDEFPMLSFELSELVDVITSTGFVRKDAADAVIEEGASFGLDARDQTIIGTGLTFTSTDFIADPSTDDSDVLRLKGISVELPAVVVENIEYLFLELDQFGRLGGRGPHHPFGPKLDTPALAKFKNLKFLDISGTLASVRTTGVETQMYLDLRGTGVSTIDLKGLTSEGLDESTFVIGDNVDTVYENSILNDTFLGGSRADTVTFTRSANVFESAGFGDDTVFHLGGSTRVDVYGPDPVTVSALSDRFSLFRAFGHAGPITINASSSSSAVNLTGGSANDVLVGGAGEDFLAGGTGQDVLTGGAGIDTFQIGVTDLSSFNTSGLGSGEVFEHGDTWIQSFDVIKDFQAGDLIDISSGENQLSVVSGPGIGFAANTNYAIPVLRGPDNILKIEFLEQGQNVDVLVFRSGPGADQFVPANWGTEAILLEGFGGQIRSLADPAFYDNNALI